MRTIKPPFPPTIYEGYELDPLDYKWYPRSWSYSDDPGLCASGLVTEGPYDWIIRRTDFCPETGQIIASFFVPQDDAIKAGEEYCVRRGIPIPHPLRTGKYDTPEEIAANEADHKHSEDKIEGRL